MSRLSDLLTELKQRRDMTNPEIVESAKRHGMKLSAGSVSNYLNGRHAERPPVQTLEAFAKVFGVPVSDLEQAAAYTGREPFQPDPTADRLTAPQRNAVNELIRLLAAGNEGADNDTAPPTTQESGTPSEADEVEKTPAPPLDRLGVDLAALKGERALDAEDEAAARRGEEPQ